MAALSIYGVISLIVLGRPLIGHFREVQIGINTDPPLFMWFLAWWPHAIANGLNPFFTRLLWAPVGLNLTWTTSIPLPSLIMWSVTATLGPVASFNCLMLIAPALAAWTTFLLCRHVCRSWWPALLGGYIFGFSDFMLSEELGGHIHTTIVFLVPLSALITVRAIQGEIATGRFIATLAAILVAQFLTSTEIFATMTIFGAMAMTVAWAYAPPDTARKIAAQMVSIGIAYAIAGIVLSPFIYWLFALGLPHGEFASSEIFSSGLLDFLANSRLPLIAVAVVYAISRWRSPVCKVLIIMALVASILALGPRLHIANRAYFELPGEILEALPMIDKALPMRFVMYSFLCLAVAASLWFASNQWGLILNCTVAAILIFLIRPGFATQRTRSVDVPAFFTDGIYRDYLHPNENVLVLPFGHRGDSMLWQADTGMYFRMAGGWTGPSPAEFAGWPIMTAFTAAIFLPDASAQLGAFMAHHRVDAAVVADDDPDAGFWRALLSGLSSAKESAGGVTVFRLSAVALTPYRAATIPQMRERADSSAVDALLFAASQWIAAGNSPVELTAAAALKRGVLNPSWCAGPTADVFSGKDIPADLPDPNWFCGAWLGAAGEGHPSAAIYGTYSELEPTIDRYRKSALHIYFPYPNDLLAPGTPVPAANARALMQIVFDKNRLAAIASQLKELQ